MIAPRGGSDAGRRLGEAPYRAGGVVLEALPLPLQFLSPVRKKHLLYEMEPSYQLRAAELGASCRNKIGVHTGPPQPGKNRLRFQGLFGACYRGFLQFIFVQQLGK